MIRSETLGFIISGLVDTHCHLDMERYFPDCEGTLRDAAAAGVSDLVVAGVDRAGWARMLELSSTYPQVHAAPGLHPIYLHLHGPGDIEALAMLVAENHVSAIGEVGLDYHVASCDRNAQQALFEAQIDIADAMRLPLLLHVRKAHDFVLATLRRKKFTSGGIVHAFNGSYQQACHFIDLGFCIGICGTITYDRAKKIRRVAGQLPLECLVLETDAPDIPPAAHWGENNQPCYLGEILCSLAEVRQEDVVELARRTTENARKVLRLA